MREHIDILLVEDNPYDQKLIMRTLERHVSGRVHVVSDGAEALDYLFATGPYTGRDLGTLPPVVLLDLKLPKIDGLEVLRRLRADPRTARQPVVLLTSSAEQRDVMEAYRLHVNSYIVKPVDFDQMTRTIRELGLYWLVMNSRPPPIGLRDLP